MSGYIPSPCITDFKSVGIVGIVAELENDFICKITSNVRIPISHFKVNQSPAFFTVIRRKIWRSIFDNIDPNGKFCATLFR